MQCSPSPGWRSRRWTPAIRSAADHVDVARALALRSEGRSWRATARDLGVHPMAVRRVIGSLSKTPTAAGQVPATAFRDEQRQLGVERKWFVAATTGSPTPR
jgi:hypothetical protein